MKYEFGKLRTKFYLWLAHNILPKPIVFWCFIVVHGASGNGPGEDYKKAYDFYSKKFNLEGKL